MKHILNLLHRWHFFNSIRIISKGAKLLLNEGPITLLRTGRLRLRDPLQFQYNQWLGKNTHGPADYEKMAAETSGFSYRPLVSILMPVYNVDPVWLQKSIDSVTRQIYPNWELCIADDASTREDTKNLLNNLDRENGKINICFIEKNEGISGATNKALAMATGEFIGLLDNDDELAPEALFEVVKLLNEDPEADFIYSDEDKLSTEGKPCEPFFKPDWSPDLLYCHMYTCHFGVYRKEIADRIGGFRKEFDGSQDYDFVLRFIEQTGRIRHIPKILYHWRKVPDSTAEAYDIKSSDDASLRALEEAVARTGGGTVEKGLHLGTFRIRRTIAGQPLVSIIIPCRDKVELTKKCINSIRRTADYHSCEMLVVDNRSVEAATREFFDEIAGTEGCRVLPYDAPFNYAAINNMAAREAAGDVLLFLNNDTEVISREWLVPMLELATRSDVGAVGAKLVFEDDTIQHAGILLGAGGIANHAFYRFPVGRHSYFNQADTIRNCSAVTGACMMTRKDLFLEAGGFDEANCPIAFNDVDYCLRLREQGYMIVYTPYAVLYHYEAVSRGSKDDPEANYMEKRWGHLIRNDPYFNPNFSRKRFDFSLKIS